jgi:hypothetical protein
VGTLMIAALALAALVYQDVPPEVERIAAYEWRAGSPPAPLDAGVSREGSRWTVAVPKAAAVIIVLHRRDGRYLLDGPIAISSDEAERRLDGVWRQTVQGGAVGAVVGTPAIEWLSAADAAADSWPACWWTAPARWACMGAPIGAAGVVIAADGHRLWSTPAGGQMAVSLRPAGWGRLVVVRDRHGGVLPGLTAAAVRAVIPPQRTKTVRLEVSALPDVRVSPVGRSAVWIAGDSSPPSAWIEIRTTRSGPAYLPLADVAEGSPQVAVQVLLDDSRVVNAVVMSDRATPAPGALVSIFRLIDPPASQGGREPPPRRVFASEAVTDDEGGVRIEGLGDAVYEIVAWHPRFGRGSRLLAADTDHVTISLQSPGIARGRVLVGGKPAAGVDVTVVPNPSAYAAADDPIDLKGGDGRSGPDGRFVVALAPGGGSEVRVGGGMFAVRRLPLPPAPLPIVELGDIDLGRAIMVSIVLNEDPGCDVRAAGPIGRTGLRIVTAVRTAPGVFSLTLPEEGSWEFGLLCGREERALAPSVVRILDQMPPGLTFVVR